jgi:hypothetical protein
MERAVREARFDDAVGRRIQDWSSKLLGDEITAALEEFVGPDRVMDDADIQIFATWFHNDREHHRRLDARVEMDPAARASPVHHEGDLRRRSSAGRAMQNPHS